jgi:hypothetical protein
MIARPSRYAVGLLLALLLFAQPLVPQAFASQPAPPDKNQAPTAQASQAPADHALVDPTGTKNDPQAQAAAAPAAGGGETQLSSPEAGSKNASTGDGAAVTPAELASVMAGADQIVTCGAYGNANWTTTSATFQVMRQCTLKVPSAGYVFLSADGNPTRYDGEYEAQFEFGIDGTTGDPNVDRWVNVYNDAGDGTDKSMALSMLAPISAGTHTFYLLGRRYAGSATVMVYDPTLTAIFIPAAAADVRVCGASGNTNWTTTSSTMQVMRQCNLTVPRAGYAFIAADTSLARQDGEYEALLEIGVDSTAGNGDIDRWINVYNDAGDGTDENARISVFQPIAAGAHTFYSLARRFTGTGTVLLYDPTLTVIFIPVPNITLNDCGAYGNANWTTTSGSFQVIRQCTVTTGSGWAFISADGNVVRQDGEYEGQFEIGVDSSTAGDGNIDRWINVYNDTGDGTDKGLALSVLLPISRGRHTFYLLGRRYAGTGTVLVYDATLSVISTRPKLYLPVLIR